MRFARFILLLSFAVALVFGRRHRSRHRGGKSGFASTHRKPTGGKTGVSSSFGSGVKSGIGAKKAPHHDPHPHTVPGGPCDKNGECSGEKEICKHKENWKACFVKRAQGESCNKWYEYCHDGSCRVKGFGKECTTKDTFADTGEVCGKNTTCFGTDVCKSCEWKPAESRCVKMVGLDEVCSDWYQMCGAGLLCEKTGTGNEAKCVKCPNNCPACHKPNDACDGCVIDDTASGTCNPCDDDDNGINGDMRCAMMDQGMCCRTSSACTSTGGTLDMRLTAPLDPKTFICSDACIMDETSTEHCDVVSQKLCVIGDPIPLQAGTDMQVKEIPTCACKLKCPACYIPDSDCLECVFDETNVAPGCDPCDVHGGHFCENVMQLGPGSCCGLDSLCKSASGGAIASRMSTFNPSTLICSTDCDSTCDRTGKNTCTFGDQITLDTPASADFASTIDPCVVV